MSARPVIQTYRLASLHEAAIARLKNPKNDRYKELYLKNREIGEKVYNAVLSGRLDLACFCGDPSKYYSVLTRSTRQDGALQVTEIDRKGPIGHRLLTGPKQLELPGCGATIAAVSDVSRCTEQEILDAVGFKMQQGLNSKAMKCKVSHHRLDDERLKIDLPKEGKSPHVNPCKGLSRYGSICRFRLMLLGWSLFNLFSIIEQFGRVAADFLPM